MSLGLDVVHEDFVDRIYEASVVPELWSDVLRLFAETAECKESVLVATNGESYRWIGSSPIAEKLALDHYSYEGGAERSRRLMKLNRPGFVSDFEVFSDEEMATIPLFRDLLSPGGFGRGVATAICIPSGETIILHAEGDLKLGKFNCSLIDQLDGVRPHFARSAMISSRLAFERASTAVETLTGLGLAACAVGPNGKVLVANAQFDRAMGQISTRAGDRIALVDSRADKQLSSALRAMASNKAVLSIALARTESAQPAILHVVPVRRSAQDLFSRASAILVLTTASNSVNEEPVLFQALFDLTPTEAAIAARVAAGHTLQRIALSDAKSVETVRKQLKSVLAKTGCRRQADLSRLLTSLVPPYTALV